MMQPDHIQRLIEAFKDYLFEGGQFRTIVEARHFATDVLGERVEGGTALAKATEEACEKGLIRAAKQIVDQSTAFEQTYDELVGLYERQPTLGSRSSTSILRQQYSTPLPIAYLTAELVGIDSSTTVYEPTAGNGALLLTADPAKVTANEIDAERAADLRARGFEVTQHDAAY